MIFRTIFQVFILAQPSFIGCMMHYSLYQCYGFLLFLLCCKLRLRRVIHMTLESLLILINRIGQELIILKYIIYSSIVNKLSMPLNDAKSQKQKAIQKPFLYYFEFICIQGFLCFVFPHLQFHLNLPAHQLGFFKN